jgi:hypothetical protein
MLALLIVRWFWTRQSSMCNAQLSYGVFPAWRLLLCLRQLLAIRVLRQGLEARATAAEERLGSMQQENFKLEDQLLDINRTWAAETERYVSFRCCRQEVVLSESHPWALVHSAVIHQLMQARFLQGPCNVVNCAIHAPWADPCLLPLCRQLTRLREDKDSQLLLKDQEVASLKQQLDKLRRGPDCRSGSTSLVKVGQVGQEV